MQRGAGFTRKSVHRLRGGSSSRGVAVVGPVKPTLPRCGLVFLLSGAERDAVFPSSFIAIVLGAVLSPFYGRLYDGGLDRRLRRALTEEYGNSPTWICEIELRREGTWVRKFGAEMLFPWSDTIDIADVDGAIELRFRGGLVVARDKAFATVDHWRKFIEAAREISKCVQSQSSSTPAGNQVS
jgi:hypothetical protein